VNLPPDGAIIAYSGGSGISGFSGHSGLSGGKKKAGGIFRQICFAPIGYIAGHLLVKGISSNSYFLVRDLAAILIAGAAVYALLSLIYLAVRRKKTA